MPAPLALTPPYPINGTDLELTPWPSEVLKVFTSLDYRKLKTAALVETFNCILNVLFPEERFTIDELQKTERSEVVEVRIYRGTHLK